MDWAGFRFQDPRVAVGRAAGRRWCCSRPGCASGTGGPRRRRSRALARLARLAPGCGSGCATRRSCWRRSASSWAPWRWRGRSTARSREDVTTQGVDIVVALDVSGSMAAEDFQPRNRLAVAKEVVAEFVERRKSDRVGLVVFAGRA